ncbi:hypothetical protein [Salinivibrio sp. SS2]|uniref:hypothetical protein n=1 Tax=Salinivibrio sp. SS2 TaxID=1892894 RepID=UPI00084C64BC|nr:hypothetical protein [Salinivibrio sp. DV]ODQ00613.1 hypothetical protein BGK46_06070 [Salinivibrio sp. DV]
MNTENHQNPLQSECAGGTQSVSKRAWNSSIENPDSIVNHVFDNALVSQIELEIKGDIRSGRIEKRNHRTAGVSLKYRNALNPFKNIIGIMVNNGFSVGAICARFEKGFEVERNGKKTFKKICVPRHQMNKYINDVINPWIKAAKEKKNKS